MQDPLAFEAVAARDVHMQVQMEERLMDVSAPIRIGDQRIGGVRIGYSLESVMDEQQCATEARSEEHTSELQSLMRSSYAVFCLKKKQTPQSNHLIGSAT